jgi:tRNA threonylcarbamoyladenosine biosynthesis protein TsaB
MEERAGGGGGLVIVLGIDTSTDQTSVALGTEREIVGTARFAGVRRHDDVVPAIERLLEWTGIELEHVGGVAVGIGPGLYTGLRVGVEAAKTLAQVLGVPIVAISSLDVLAFGVQHTSRRIVAVIDARRREVFYGLYRPVPGGVMRDGDYRVASPHALAAELEIERDEMLLVGNGAILYRKEFEQVDARVELAPATFAHPWASALVSLAAPRFIREQTDRPADLVPMYLRKTDAEITWDQRARGASA